MGYRGEGLAKLKTELHLENRIETKILLSDEAFGSEGEEKKGREGKQNSLGHQNKKVDGSWLGKRKGMGRHRRDERERQKEK